MAEELLVVLNRSESQGFGFSLLGTPGLPPIIYNILDDSPAAESGEVEVGDVILKVNETDVVRFSTKEVLKCLRLSSDPVTLKIKRDPKIKATLKKHLLSGGGSGDLEKSNKLNSVIRPEPAVHQPAHHGRFTTNGSCPEEEPLLFEQQKQKESQQQQQPLQHQKQHQEENDRLQWQPLAANANSNSNANEKSKGPPKFEAYMMTGEHILNISRMPQTILPKQQRKVENLRYHNSHAHHLRHQKETQQFNSVPNSPNEMELGKKAPNSANTSPSANRRGADCGGGATSDNHSPGDPYTNFVRTSRSEDPLGANAEMDEDITSSLNTLLDTRPDSASGGAVSDSDRIVWTYNAPVSEQHKFAHALSNGSSNSSHSNSSSPLHSGSPASPTSVSSSVMSSQSGSRRLPPSTSNGVAHPHSNYNNNNNNNTTGDFSISEAVSNISSPDYHDDDSVMRDCVMEISDASDSDSTLLVSEPRHRRNNHNNNYNSSSSAAAAAAAAADSSGSDHKIVIQVKGPDKNKFNEEQYLLHKNDDDERENRNSSPLSSEDESDVDSLHSYHYSPKAVDMPSAIRLAKRLFMLDGFKKSDVSRHLSKNNDFSRAVAEEYLKYFDFETDTLDIALRKFLKQFSLTGETQERERVLVHFSKRYLDCNPGSFNSQDAVHTLTCAIMLLNTDLHDTSICRKMKMSCNEFIENLSGLNECENFPREVLKHLYYAIKNYPLEWALDEDAEDGTNQTKTTENISLGGNPFLAVPVSTNAIEYKKGYVMRKCCYEANAKRTPFHKRSWKMFYCTLRDLVLYLHKDEHGFRKNQMGDNLHNAIRIHHALATKASDYTKKQYVFRLQTADQAEYLFQTSDSKELQIWIDTINLVCASFSAPPLEAAVGSQKKFQRPLLPCSHTKLSLRDQLADHEERVLRLEAMLDEHHNNPPEKGAKSLTVQNYKEKEAYLNYELKRYRTYSYMLRSRMSQYPELGVSLVENSIGEMDEAAAAASASAATNGGCSSTSSCGNNSAVTLIDDNASGIVPPPIPERPSPTINRKGPE